eukprot:6454639-Ditylum_brightwellii.AAC.1
MDGVRLNNYAEKKTEKCKKNKQEVLEKLCHIHHGGCHIINSVISDATTTATANVNLIVKIIETSTD